PTTRLAAARSPTPSPRCMGERRLRSGRRESHAVTGHEVDDPPGRCLMSVLTAPRRLMTGVRARLRGPGDGERFLDRPYASVQLLLLAASGLLLFGILMAVSTTIAASHQADGSGTGAIWTQVIK